MLPTKAIFFNDRRKFWRQHREVVFIFERAKTLYEISDSVCKDLKTKVGIQKSGNNNIQ